MVNTIRSLDISFLCHILKKNMQDFGCFYFYDLSGNMWDTKLGYLLSKSGLYHSKPFATLLYFFNKYYHCHQLNWLLTHWGRGHLNCLNTRSRGLNNINQLLYCVSLKIYNKFANYYCELKFSGNTHQRP